MNPFFSTPKFKIGICY